MNVIPINKLYEYNFSVEVVNALRLYWRDRDSFNFLGQPKKSNLLLYLHKCHAEYTLPDGRHLYAPSGSLIYTAVGSQYRVRIFDKQDDSAYTVGTNFYLFDENGAPFLLSNDVEIFPHIDCRSTIDTLEQLSTSSLRSPARMKARFYDILMLLCEDTRRQIDSRFQVIYEGIRYMEHDTQQQLSVAQIAKLCNVSEIYFRRLFKEYSGHTPSQYRINAKVEQAKNLLAYDELNTAQIAQQLGFADPSYFCRQFKAHTGMTPQQYRTRYTQL